MATQTGIYVTAPNEPYTIVSTIPRPVPGPKQVLVKSLVTGINPVEPIMHRTGSNIISPFPAVIGCEASGVVLEVGGEVTRFRPGDGIFGCTRVGQSAYATFQEAFLMDEAVAFKRPEGMSAEEGSTLGVAIMTAAVSLLTGLGVEVPEPGSKIEEKDEWIVVLGGSGSVGAVGVQLARLAGYKVLASCSPSKTSIPLSYGAAATLDRTLDLDGQLSEIKKITNGNFSRVFDASAQAHDVAVAALQRVSTAQEKLYSTTNTWLPLTTPPGIREHRTKMGVLGQDTPLGVKVTADLAAWVPKLEKHVADGGVRPLGYQLVEGKGWEAVIRAAEMFESGGAARKLAVRVQDE